MSKKLTNSVADLVRALQILKPQNDVDLLSLVKLLGYRFKLRESTQPPPTKPTGLPASKKSSVPDKPSQGERKHSRRSRKPLPSVLTLLTGADHAPPDWLRTVPHLEEATSARIKSRIPLKPLFRPVWTRAILNDALSAPGGGGEIDIDSIVRKISYAQPITELPRRQVPTLIRGVQLLVDCSKAMEPFAEDQTLLKAAIYSVVGREKTKVLYFSGIPLEGVGNDLQDEWGAYTPAPPGTPVLALTDLGIGDPGFLAERSDAEEWLEFSELLRELGCPLITFVPYPESRWPGMLKDKMKILQWDRPTNISAVRRSIGQTLVVR